MLNVRRLPLPVLFGLAGVAHCAFFLLLYTALDWKVFIDPDLSTVIFAGLMILWGVIVPFSYTFVTVVRKTGFGKHRLDVETVYAEALGEKLGGFFAAPLFHSTADVIPVTTASSAERSRRPCSQNTLKQ